LYAGSIPAETQWSAVLVGYDTAREREYTTSDKIEQFEHDMASPVAFLLDAKKLFSHKACIICTAAPSTTQVRLRRRLPDSVTFQL